MNSDRRNIWHSQESQCVTSTSQSYRESEFVQSDPTYHESFRCSQGSARTCNESSMQQDPQSGTFSQIQDYIQINSEQLSLPRPEVKNFDIVSQNRNSKCLSYGSRNFSDFGSSNPQSSGESSRNFNYSESQPIEIRHPAEKIAYTIPQSHEWRSSFQEHHQELGMQPNVPMHAFTGEVSQQRWVSSENIHFRPSDNNEISNIENTLQVRSRNEHLYPESKNANHSVFSNQYLGNEQPFNQQYLPEYSIEQSTQQQNGNQCISDDLQKTLNVQADMPGIADPGQSAQIPTSYGVQVNQLSTTHADENLLRSLLGKNSLFANRRANISPFSKDYSKNYHLSLNRQSLQRNELIHSSQGYHGRRMNFVEDPETFKAQACPPKLPDQRLSEYTQSTGIRLFNQQTWTSTGGKSVSGLRNSGTSHTEMNPHKSLQSLSNIPENRGFGFHNDIQWDDSRISGESNAPFLTRVHLAQETKTAATTSDEQNRYKLNISPSCATTSGEIVHATSPVSIHHKNSESISKTICLESYTIPFSSEQWENMSDSNVSRNANIPGNFTAYTEDANILQYLKNSSQENRNFSRNCNLNKNYQDETQNQESFAYSQQTHTNEIWYPCNFCPKSFDRIGNLNRHMVTHTNERPYQCTSCSKTFKRKWNLDSHILSHTNQRLYACNTCAKRFKRKNDLNQHMQTHTNEKPYSCNVCTKRFKRKEQLDRHMQTHTNEKPYPCNVCSKRFKRKENLNRHIRIVHKNERPCP